MKAKLFCSLFLTSLLVGIGINEFLAPLAYTQVADKINVAYVKLSMTQELFAAAAEQWDLWRQNGLDANVLTLAGGGDVGRGIAARSVDLGLASSSMTFGAAAGGVPLVVVADMHSAPTFSLWVRAASPHKTVQDLSGATFGTTRFGGIAHAFSRAVVKIGGLEGKSRIVATGGLREMVAALKVGSVDAIVHDFMSMVELKTRGEVREVVKLADYLPKEWTEYGAIANKHYAREKPEPVKRAMKAVSQGIDLMKKNPDWSRTALKRILGYSDEAIKLVYDELKVGFPRDTRVNVGALENVRNFLIEYGIVPKDKTPTLGDLVWAEAK